MAGAAAPTYNPGYVPTQQELANYAVNRDGWEAIRWRFYDTAVYAAAGQGTLTFFSTPVGQGTSPFTGVKTLSDTNMTLAGQLPTNQNFLVQSVEVGFYPSTPTVAAAMPAAFGAQAVAVQVNDAYIFRRSGNLIFTIGSKPYLQEAPMMSFPLKSDFAVMAATADVTTAGANLQTRIAYATAQGRPYMLNPPLVLDSNQNFAVSLNWPEGVQAISNPAKVQVILDGILYRRSQ